MKYVIFKEQGPVQFFRIMALRDIPRHGIKAGDVGGTVDGYHNLSQSGDCWIKETAIVLGHSKVSGNAIVSGHSSVLRNVTISGNAVVTGYAFVRGESVIKDNAIIDGRASIEGKSVVCDNATVKDSATVRDSVVGGDAKVFGDAELYGTVTKIGHHYGTRNDSYFQELIKESPVYKAMNGSNE